MPTFQIEFRTANRRVSLRRAYEPQTASTALSALHLALDAQGIAREGREAEEYTPGHFVVTLTTRTDEGKKTDHLGRFAVTRV